MKRKFIALALAFTLAFGFTGCMDDWDEEVTEETVRLLPQMRLRSMRQTVRSVKTVT